MVRIPALTLIDTLDTLIIMGNLTEFGRATERLRDFDESTKHGVDNKGHAVKIEGGGMFAQNQNASVFETTIRVLGGLLSSNAIKDDSHNKTQSRKECCWPFLEWSRT